MKCNKLNLNTGSEVMENLSNIQLLQILSSDHILLTTEPGKTPNQRNEIDYTCWFLFYINRIEDGFMLCLRAPRNKKDYVQFKINKNENIYSEIEKYMRTTEYDQEG